jgi:hypothetical protein
VDTRHHCAVHHGTAAGAVTVLPPGAAHTSYPAARAGQLRKRGLAWTAISYPPRLVGSAWTGHVAGAGPYWNSH